MDVLVDVGIPTYGSPRYLREAIEDVAGQTFAGWRLTISDNGGGNAEEAVRPYLTDPRISYSRNPENIGLTGNLSKLVRESEAKYVALLHDDDRWEPRFLERRVGFLEDHPECGFVFAPGIDIDESGREIKRHRAVAGEGVYPPPEFVPRLLRDPNAQPNPPTVLVRNAAYREVGPYFDGRFTVTDLEMWLRLALRFPVGYLPVWDTGYRFHANQTSASISWGEPWLAFQEHAEALVAEHLPAAQFTPRERRERRASAYLSIALDRLRDGERRSALGAAGTAIRLYPPAALDPRVPALLVASVLGARSRRLVQRLRYSTNRRGIRLPFHARH
jgi:glycosyltransferase involved in cell wall biosynthesis